MASAKDLKKKIRSISNTKKITRTMEMVATVKSKMGSDRVKATTPYSVKLAEILSSLAASGSIAHPLLERPDAGPPKKTLLLIVTGNRGMAGGYNANVLGMAEDWLEAERGAGRDVEVQMFGRKGIARFRFLKLPIAKSYTHIKDLPTFRDAEEIADDFLRRFLAGEVDRIVIIATKYHSASVQKPAVLQLLPIAPPPISARPIGASGEKAGAPEGPAERQGRAAGTIDFIFVPDREEILKALLPLSVKNAVLRSLVEATTSEQIARRIAMKLATDNAEEIIKHYTRKYNRQRQAGITQQITEIVSGAEALE